MEDRSALTLDLCHEDGNARHCNQAQAPYVLSARGAVTITPSAATLAACGEDSLSGRFVQDLGQVTVFQTDGETLLLQDGEGAVILMFSIAPSALGLMNAGAVRSRPDGAIACLPKGRQRRRDNEFDEAHLDSGHPGDCSAPPGMRPDHTDANAESYRRTDRNSRRERGCD